MGKTNFQIFANLIEMENLYKEVSLAIKHFHRHIAKFSSKLSTDNNRADDFTTHETH